PPGRRRRLPSPPARARCGPVGAPRPARALASRPQSRKPNRQATPYRPPPRELVGAAREPEATEKEGPGGRAWRGGSHPILSCLHVAPDSNRLERRRVTRCAQSPATLASRTERPASRRPHATTPESGGRTCPPPEQTSATPSPPAPSRRSPNASPRSTRSK